MNESKIQQIENELVRISRRAAEIEVYHRMLVAERERFDWRAWTCTVVFIAALISLALGVGK